MKTYDISAYRTFRGDETQSAMESFPIYDSQRTSSLAISTALAQVFDGTCPDHDKLNRLGAALVSPDDTYDDVLKWINASPELDLGLDIIKHILHTIKSDTAGMIHSINTLLKDVERESSQDHILQNRINYWRTLFVDLKRHIIEVRTDLDCFLAWLVQNAGSFLPNLDFTETRQSLCNVLDQLEVKQSLLLAQMTLLENKRGIAEAESVGKLTDLGFIFIPASCVAAFFSMDVIELENGVPVRWVVCVVVTVLFLTYLIRIFVRSETIIDIKRQLAARIRADAKLLGDVFIPTRYVIRFVYRKTRFMVLNVWVITGLWLSVLLIPFFVLFSKPLPLDYKLLLLTMAIPLSCYWMSCLLSRAFAEKQGSVWIFRHFKAASKDSKPKTA